MKLFFRLLSVLWLISTIGLIFWYFYLWDIELLKDFLYTHKELYFPWSWESNELDREFIFIVSCFGSLFLFIWAWLMSGLIKMIFMPLIMALIFWSLWYYLEVVRFGFYIAASVNIIIFFVLFSTLPSFSQHLWIFTKIKGRTIRKLKEEWIEREGEFIQVITDYSIKINNRPAQKALIKVIHPITWVEQTIESERSFDPYFAVWIPTKIPVYFDRHDENKYFCDINKIK